MKISHKLCVRIDGTQFYYYDGLQPKMSMSVVRPSRIPHRNQKIIFVSGSYESLERLKGKIGEAPFSKVQSGKKTVCII